MEKFLKALGKVLIVALYVIVVVVVIGVIRWLWKLITGGYD